MTTTELKTINLETTPKARLAEQIRALKRMLDNRKPAIRPEHEVISDDQNKLHELEDVYCFMISKR